MFNKEFLKTLTVMYVEDDEIIRSSLGSILSKIFGNVIVCNDGSLGLEQFKNHTIDKKLTIDAIISDINMPNMNGIEMVKAIRELDSEVPIVFTTAHGESNYLMDAIKLKIVYYALKPIDTTELLKNISKFCMIEHNKQLIFQKEKEISTYMDIMNHISSIFKVDIDGNIIESNEMLVEISKYSNQELLSMKIDDILHHDALITTYKDILKIVDNNDTYKGKLKFQAKDETSFYLNITIIPRYNSSTATIDGYIYIGFDQTDEELEKQQTMQRVRKNIISQRTKESTLTKQVKKLEETIAKLKASTLSDNDTQLVMDKLSKEKQKVATLNSQMEHYEDKISMLTKQKEDLVSGHKDKKATEKNKKNKSSSEMKLLQTKIIELQSKISKLEAKLRPKSYD